MKTLSKTVKRTVATTVAASNKIDEDLRKKFRDGIEHLKTIIVAPEHFWANFAAANLIRNSVSEMVGAPGVGKTTLIQAAGKVLFGEGNTCVLNSYEGIKSKDTLFDVSIEQHQIDEKVNAFVFEVLARTFMSSKFALLNELNRAGKEYLNSFLSVFSEGFLEVKGKRLYKTPGKVWIDYNPYYGCFDAAFADRIISSVVMEEANILDQLTLANRKYGSTNGDRRHVTNLVDLANQHLDAEQMGRVWDDVTKVEFPEKYMGHALLSLNIFRACKWKLGSVSQAFKDRLECDGCQYREFCLTKMLHRPVLTRSLDSFVEMAKAFAYFDGRNQVETERDLIPALKAAVVHRLDLKAEPMETHPHEFAWFDEVAVPILKSRVDEWKGAKKVFDEVNASISKGQQKEAVAIYEEYLSKAADITAVSMLKDFAGTKINKMSAAVHHEVMAKVELFKDNKVEFSKPDLKKLEKDYAWLPKDQLTDIKDGINYLVAILDGRMNITKAQYAEMLRKLEIVHSGVLAKLTLPEGATYATFEETDLQIRTSLYGENVEVAYTCTSSKEGHVISSYNK